MTAQSQQNMKPELTPCPAWVEEFKIDTSTWESFAKEASTQGLSPLALACERGFIDESAFLRWEQSRCGWANLNKDFFNQEPKTEILKKYDFEKFKKEGVFPIGEWDGSCYFAKLSSDSSDLSDTLPNAVFVLAPWSGLKKWFHFWKQQVPVATVEPSLNENAADTLTKIDFSAIPLPVPPKPQTTLTAPAEPLPAQQPQQQSQEQAQASQSPKSFPVIDVPDLGIPEPSSSISPDLGGLTLENSNEKLEVLVDFDLKPISELIPQASQTPNPDIKVSADAVPPTSEPQTPAAPVMPQAQLKTKTPSSPVMPPAPSMPAMPPAPPPTPTASTLSAAPASPAQTSPVTAPPQKGDPVPAIPVDQVLDITRQTRNFDQLSDVILGAWKNYFSQSMVLTLKSEVLTNYKEIGPWKFKANNKVSVILDKASIFKIVADTAHAYHGYVIENHINKEFYSNSTEGLFPEHVTLIPLFVNNTVFGIIYGSCTKEVGRNLSLSNLESMAASFSEQLTKLMSGLKKAG